MYLLQINANYRTLVNAGNFYLSSAGSSDSIFHSTTNTIRQAFWPRATFPVASEGCSGSLEPGENSWHHQPREIPLELTLNPILEIFSALLDEHLDGNVFICSKRLRIISIASWCFFPRHSAAEWFVFLAENFVYTCRYRTASISCIILRSRRIFPSNFIDARSKIQRGDIEFFIGRILLICALFISHEKHLKVNIFLGPSFRCFVCSRCSFIYWKK